MNYQTINSIYLPEPNSDSVLTHSNMTWPRAWAQAYRSFSPFLNSMSSTFLATSSHSQAAHGRYGASATPLNSQSLSHFFTRIVLWYCQLVSSTLGARDTWHLQLYPCVMYVGFWEIPLPWALEALGCVFSGWTHSEHKISMPIQF